MGTTVKKSASVSNTPLSKLTASAANDDASAELAATNQKTSEQSQKNQLLKPLSTQSQTSSLTKTGVDTSTPKRLVTPPTTVTNKKQPVRKTTDVASSAKTALSQAQNGSTQKTK